MSCRRRESQMSSSLHLLSLNKRFMIIAHRLRKNIMI